MTKSSILAPIKIPLPDYQKNPKYEKLEKGFFPFNDQNYAQCLINKDVETILLNLAVCKNNQEDLVLLIESFNGREFQVIEKP